MVLIEGRSSKITFYKVDKIHEFKRIRNNCINNQIAEFYACTNNYNNLNSDCDKIFKRQVAECKIQYHSNKIKNIK